MCLMDYFLNISRLCIDPHQTAIHAAFLKENNTLFDREWSPAVSLPIIAVEIK